LPLFSPSPHQEELPPFFPVFEHEKRTSFSGKSDFFDPSCNLSFPPLELFFFNAISVICAAVFNSFRFRMPYFFLCTTSPLGRKHSFVPHLTLDGKLTLLVIRLIEDSVFGHIPPLLRSQYDAYP